jgi:hypothetical protein
VQKEFPQAEFLFYKGIEAAGESFYNAENIYYIRGRVNGGTYT